MWLTLVLKKWTKSKYRLELWPPDVSKKEEMLVFKQLLTFLKHAVPLNWVTSCSGYVESNYAECNHACYAEWCHSVHTYTECQYALVMLSVIMIS